ncbi:hypothetical protein HNR60_004035 [Rhodopseudomonas rhenobacensis]|uniref:DUF2442 domain-containing protein n=1 Tax=Rhodopseudomonas rhenobacensis TaxID=87461 RepID=A0A7W7Z7B7_9BRAD|nr:hypothetical protein [Rhodopseudomonas rhenobacensis]MBB5049259.1 hypothetical protein [Rhodopseudomonas rhenobacensis]
MSATDMVDSGTVLPRIAIAEPRGLRFLRVVWSEGSRAGREDVIDLSPALFGYKVYKPLRDDATLFATARLIEDGDVVAWDGDELEMSADLLLALADETMTAAEFRAFLDRHQLTQEAAGVLLGRSRRQIANYTAAGPIPRIVALACYGFEARKRAPQGSPTTSGKGRATIPSI